jgi:hypothetical protein
VVFCFKLPALPTVLMMLQLVLLLSGCSDLQASLSRNKIG